MTRNVSSKSLLTNLNGGTVDLCMSWGQAATDKPATGTGPRLLRFSPPRTIRNGRPTTVNNHQGYMTSRKISLPGGAGAVDPLIELQAHSQNPSVQMIFQGTQPMVAEPLMAAQAVDPDPPPTPYRDTVPRSLEIRLYVSHFLSTWNSRLFEFAAVLFLASIFPGTLLPMSVYALVRSGAAIIFGQSIGSLIDRGNRLAVVRASIIGQRLAVAASCGLFWALERRGQWMDERLSEGLFAVTVVLACVEKLCAVMNLVSVERDWVVVITEGNESARRGSSSTQES